MAKCAEDGCRNKAIKGAKLCEYHRDKQNETKDAWLKASLGLCSCLLLGVVGFFTSRGQGKA